MSEGDPGCRTDVNPYRDAGAPVVGAAGVEMPLGAHQSIAAYPR